LKGGRGMGRMWGRQFRQVWQNFRIMQDFSVACMGAS
jgi:hypothetical protein